MAISFYSGRPGAGKSYITVERVVVPALNKGRIVVTNIPLTDKARDLAKEKGATLVEFPRGKYDMEAIADMLLGPVDDETGEYAPNPDHAGAVFVLDEMSMLMPAGVKQNQIPDKVKAFFSMHRHISGHGFSTEIIVVSQDSSQLNVYVKTMIERSYRIEKTMIGKRAVVNFTIYSGCVGYRGGASKPVELKKETIKYKPDIFEYYQSQTMGDGGNLDETSTDDSTNLLNSPAIKMLVGAVIFFPFLIWFAIDAFSGIFGSGQDLIDEMDKQVVNAPAEINQGIDLNNARPVTELAAPKDLISAENEDILQITKPIGDEGYMHGRRFWYLGSTQEAGKPKEHILIVETDKGGAQRVYASVLAELGIIVEEKKGGVMVITINDEVMLLAKYQNNPTVIKPFFGS